MTPNSPLQIAKEVILAEAAALTSTAEKLDDSFLSALSLILEMQEIGRVVVSGMGKAGIIGMKISATLASIGIPSYFLHPAEAVHGDLGRYTKFDVALLISNSGETQELLEMLPFLRRVGCSVISFSASLDSTLARHSDVAVPIGKHTEAGPLGLAPTTSTTVMLALGDALAMALQNKIGTSESEFARFHPAGSLGRSLLTVEEIMRKGDEMCTVSEHISCREVLQRITDTRGRPGAAIIITESGDLAGIFTDGDLRRCLGQDESFLNDPVSKHMGTSPAAVPIGTLVKEATILMNNRRIDQLIVINKANRPVGLLDIQDAVSVRLR
ncbi:MAG: KpsF/GutQ family sugar-phosphate isomerase [Bdellovibrionales bacterium]|nr:KpsF/GutQ family sugar-phosphate isomerase [Bdellovibrionales bacterium]